MKKRIGILAVVLLLTAALSFAVFADSGAMYPVSVSRTADGSEIRKYYELSPNEDPAGIPRSDFEQAGFHYTLLDLLKQEQPEYEEQEHTETVEMESEKKDMESVLALLPQQKEFVTEDGFSGILTLRLDTIRVEPAGYKYYNYTPTATRSYPGMVSQDTSMIPKSIQEGSHTLTLQNVDWRADSTTEVDGYQLGSTYTAVATYSTTALGSSVTGYTVTADYTGTVSRTALNKIRYVAVFEGVDLNPQPSPEPSPEPLKDHLESPAPQESPAQNSDSVYHFTLIWILLGILAALGCGIGIALVIKRRRESDETEE